MNRVKVEDYLIADGIPTALIGFRYLTSAIMHFPQAKGITTGLYPLVAIENNTTPQRVERAIRHAISKRKSPEAIKNSEYISLASLMLERAEGQ